MALKYKKGQDIKCYFCSSIFYRYRSAMKKKNFCSISCRAKEAKLDPCYGIWNVGLRRSLECIERNRLFHLGRCGENSSNWKGGISIGANEKTYSNERCRLRRVRKLNSGGTHSRSQWEELKQEYNFMCLCCKQQEPFIKLSEDHIIPLSCGGSDDIENIQPLCFSCNRRKNVRVIDFRSEFSQLDQTRN